MQKLLFILLFQLFTIFSCTSSGPKSKNAEWVTAKESKELTCSAWPLGEKDLNVEDISPLMVRPFGYQAYVRQRNGAHRYIYSNYEAGSAVELSSLNMRDFGQGSLALGVAVMGKDVFVPVVRPSGTSNSFIELRSLNSNVVLFKSDTLGLRPTNGRVVHAKGGIWLDMNVGDSLKILTFITKKDGKFVLQKTERFNNAADTLIAQGEGKKAYGVTAPNQTTPIDGRIHFQLSIFDPDTARPESQSLALPLTESVESWNVGGGDRTMVIAYVDGDSLIGKGTLRLVSLQANVDQFTEKFSKDFPMKNNHLSEPFVLHANGKNIVMVVRWIDKDSVLSVYDIGREVKHVGDFGTLEMGSRISGAFYDAEKENLSVIVREKHENFWDYRICQIGVDL